MHLIFCIFFTSLLSAVNVVSIGDEVFAEKDFFSKYGVDEWERATHEQKNRMLNDYIKREACAIDAKALGFTNDPSISVKLRDRSNMVRVNTVYEELVARPLVSDEKLQMSRNHIKTEIDVSHILVAFNESRLKEPPARTKDEAFLLAQKVRSELDMGKAFEELAKKYSDDVSAKQNGGSLGWVSWGRTMDAFQNEAFILNPGEFSDPVLTDFGYHIIYVKNKRPSAFEMLSGHELEDAVYNTSRGSVRHLLRQAASDFDSTNLAQANVVYDGGVLEKIVQLVATEKERKKIIGQYKVDLVSLFNDVEDVGVVCLFNNKAFGLKWFAQKLKSTPASRHPQLGSVEEVRSAFNIIILQDIATTLGYEKDIYSRLSFKKQFSSMENSLLYDTYLKWLVNSAEKPDSSTIKAYYHAHKDEKYMDPEKVVVREIRVSDRELADSLFFEIENGLEFEEAATLFSRTNPSKGGLKQPFSEGKYNDMGAVAFALNIGDMSDVIENLDRSFSIIRVEERLPEQYSEFRKVYTRIESLLTRENQNKSKTEGVDSLFEKYNITINRDFFDVDAIN
jgi:parvulin-like peptidyl-prolyl isomerase